ncbi:hypothetical protein TIFTF001_006576 [Ficus carica]|uniref:Uncharacterized protein n=1 Tax=Ficus carica TaxID=3494 RepID=A0AA87ZPL5_FICCA|nr:hypothetical protein TIFTF001_006576 [Ficus carica]
MLAGGLLMWTRQGGAVRGGVQVQGGFCGALIPNDQEYLSDRLILPCLRQYTAPAHRSSLPPYNAAEIAGEVLIVSVSSSSESEGFGGPAEFLSRHWTADCGCL